MALTWPLCWPTPPPCQVDKALSDASDPLLAMNTLGMPSDASTALYEGKESIPGPILHA